MGCVRLLNDGDEWFDGFQVVLDDTDGRVADIYEIH